MLSMTTAVMMMVMLLGDRRRGATCATGSSGLLGETLAFRNLLSVFTKEIDWLVKCIISIESRE